MAILSIELLTELNRNHANKHTQVMTFSLQALTIFRFGEFATLSDQRIPTRHANSGILQ